MRTPPLLLTASALLLVALPRCSQTGDPTAPGPTPTPGPGCRDYATQAVLQRTVTPVGVGGTGSAVCAFERKSASLSCTETWVFSNGCQLERTIVRSYASVAGFVQEHSPSGRNLALSEQRTDSFRGGCAGTILGATSWSYDSQARLLSTSITGPTTREDLSFGSWDSSGRPVTGTLSDLAFCKGIPLTLSYSDATLQWLTAVGQVGTLCGWTERTTLDGNRNVVQFDRVDGIPPTQTTIETTVLATEQVCP